MPNYAKDLRERKAIAQKQGFTLARASRHLIWRHPNGAQVASPATGSDRRGLLNFEAELRRAIRKRQANRGQA